MVDWRMDVREAARRHLSSGCSSLLKNAIFLCERLTEGTDSPDPIDILMHATCLERNGEFRSALNVLDKVGKGFLDSNEDARFLKATCLYKLGSYVDAKACLLYNPEEDRVLTGLEIRRELDDTGRTRFVPKQAYGLHLLGLISSQHAELEEEANGFFELALRLDPYLFQARERIAISKGRTDPALPVPISELAEMSGGGEKQGGMATEETRTSNIQKSPNSLQQSVSAEVLLRMLETIAYLLAAYRCDEALNCAGLLPLEQQRTSYVLGMVGRGYFEKAEYPAACSAFERMRSTDPNRTEGLEMFSTALWHLKREVDLAYLARDVAERAPRSPQTWCVVGNCFSLEKEHDLAIRFFKRALQLDENFTYAYTLAGHEYIANEDFDEATACYRHALRTDRSHYNAWWGLGTIYSRQEKHELAELHFRRAINIHPTSSVLWCFLGTVLARVERYDEALEALDSARQLQPSNPQARFQRAKVLCNVNRYAEALTELEFVRDVVPKEASVHMLMGRVCNKLKQRDRAMIHFVAALDLDPKGAADVREAISQLDESLVEPPGQRDFDLE